MIIDDIWLHAANKTKHPQDPLDVFNDWQRDALATIERRAPELYQGIVGKKEWKRKDIYELARHVSADDKKHYRVRLLFLAKGIVAGNQKHQWELPVSPILLKINREKNHITPERFATRDQWQSFLDAYVLDLEKPLPKDAGRQIGQLLISAIFYGGLIDAKWLVPFCKALVSRNLFQEQGLLWLEMERSRIISRKKASRTELRQTRRWVADPLTQLLIYRYLRQNHDSVVLESPWKHICSYLGGLRGCDARPGTLGAMLGWAFDRYTVLLPGLLIGYARGDVLSASLPASAWLRTITGKLIPVSSPDPPEPVRRRLRKNPIVVGDHVRKEEQIALFKNLLVLLDPNRLDKALYPRHGRKIIQDFVKGNQGRMSVCLQMLLGWARQLLSPQISELEGRYKKSPLAVGSVYRYLNEIGIGLLNVCGLHDPRMFNPIDLEMLYEQVNLFKNSKVYNARRLEYFHGYLRAFHDLPRLDFVELFAGLDGQSINVDANIITPAIYSALLDHFNWNKLQDRWQEVRCNAIILGYRLGLRPSEIQALRLDDLYFGARPEVLIRNSFFLRTKTHAGRRRITLELLSDEEINYLKCFYDQRKAEQAMWKNELYLHYPVRKTGMLADEELFEPVRQALREITGDQTLRFYSLRHTCFTHLNTMMLLRDDISAENIPMFEHPDFSVQRRDRLTYALFQNERCGRKFTYGIAMLAGHLSPRTTFKHYIHLADWQLGYYLRHNDNNPKINYRSIMEITGLSQATVYYHLDRGTQAGQGLLPLVKAQSKNFEQELKHPLMLLAQPIKIKAVRKERVSVSKILPTWEKALVKYKSLEDPLKAGYRIAKILPNATDWALAAKVYSSISSASQQEQSTFADAIRHANLDNFPGRWGGINYKSKSEVSGMLALLECCHVPKETWLLIHHPCRGQNERQKERYLNYWRKVFNSSWAIQREECDKKQAAQGIVTLVIANREITVERLKSARTPRMSYGFIFGLDLFLKEYELLNGQ